MNDEYPEYPITLMSLFKLFGKLGIFGFGGPATHIAMFEREVVQERNWISEDEFLGLLGATDLIPSRILQRWVSTSTMCSRDGKGVVIELSMDR